MRYRILAKSFGNRGPWWIMAAFRLQSDALEYWGRAVPDCWHAKLMQGRSLIQEHIAR